MTANTGGSPEQILVVFLWVQSLIILVLNGFQFNCLFVCFCGSSLIRNGIKIRTGCMLYGCCIQILCISIQTLFKLYYGEIILMLLLIFCILFENFATSSVDTKLQQLGKSHKGLKFLAAFLLNCHCFIFLTVVGRTAVII